MPASTKSINAATAKNILHQISQIQSATNGKLSLANALNANSQSLSQKPVELAIMTARQQISVKSPNQMQIKKALSFQKRKLNIKPHIKDEASTLEAIFKSQSEILSAQKQQRDKLMMGASRNHQVSHDVPDDENLDESNEVIETETSVKKRQQRTSINLSGNLEASKKLTMSSAHQKPTLLGSNHKTLPLKHQGSEAESQRPAMLSSSS